MSLDSLTFIDIDTRPPKLREQRRRLRKAVKSAERRSRRKRIAKIRDAEAMRAALEWAHRLDPSFAKDVCVERLLDGRLVAVRCVPQPSTMFSEYRYLDGSIGRL